MLVRIEHSRVHPSELHLYHRNPRIGDVEVIAASLRANGQYRSLAVNRGTFTDRPMEVLAGNHTVKAIRTLAERYPDDERWQGVAIDLIDVDDDAAARIVAADNRTAELGAFDDQVLFDLLSELPDLEGTGYKDFDLSALEYLLTEGGGGDGTSSEESDDQDVLDESDQAVWPMIHGRVAPVLYDTFKVLPGADDAAKLTHLLSTLER